MLIGSNDIIRRDLRARLPGDYRAMLSALPKGALVATVPRMRGVQAEVNRIVHEAEYAGAVVAVPLHFAAGARAPDHFHPDDTGYAAIAATGADLLPFPGPPCEFWHGTGDSAPPGGSMARAGSPAGAGGAPARCRAAAGAWRRSGW